MPQKSKKDGNLQRQINMTIALKKTKNTNPQTTIQKTWNPGPDRDVLCLQNDSTTFF